MVTRAARELKNGEVVFVGIGLPNFACNLARRLHAPDLVLIYEAGAVGAVPSRLPLSIGDPCLVTDSISICSMVELFNYYLQGGLIDVGFLGGAQVDKFGNINSTVIGDYKRPKIRLPGSGGACEIAINSKKTIIILKQNKKTFPETIDFITSPGYIDKSNQRTKYNMPGRGPALVITDFGVYHFSDKNHEMVLFEIYPNVSFDELKGNISWDIKVIPELAKTSAPTREELSIIREDLDPKRIHLR
ncbi:MAG: CoA-transferase subunit beta [Candidatus Aminicenantes bacterium]|nr:MAG: CoA-transferase subunit beta [Candidatus Aminicenantes bacterium]